MNPISCEEPKCAKALVEKQCCCCCCCCSNCWRLRSFPQHNQGDLLGAHYTFAGRRSLWFGRTLSVIDEFVAVVAGDATSYLSVCCKAIQSSRCAANLLRKQYSQPVEATSSPNTSVSSLSLSLTHSFAKGTVSSRGQRLAGSNLRILAGRPT